MSELVILQSLTLIIGTTFFGLPTSDEIQFTILGIQFIHIYLAKNTFTFSGHQNSYPVKHEHRSVKSTSS